MIERRPKTNRILTRVPSELTPVRALNLWQVAHRYRRLTAAQRKSFLSNETLARILKYPPAQAAAAISRYQKLTDALAMLQMESLPTRLSASEKHQAAKVRVSSPTKSEEVLWSRLRNRQIRGYLFRREVNVFGWYVDFLCQETHLVVEVDGGSHRSKRDSDQRRDEVMRASGFTTHRVASQRVLNDLDAVVQEIAALLPAVPSRKASRRKVTAQSTPKAPARRAPIQQKSVNSGHKPVHSGSPQASKWVVETKGPARCPTCSRTFIAIHRSDSGLASCRSCGGTPVALCKKCKRPVANDQGSFVCALHDGSVHAIAVEAAGRGSQHPTNNLQQARRGRRAW